MPSSSVVQQSSTTPAENSKRKIESTPKRIPTALLWEEFLFKPAPR